MAELSPPPTTLVLSRSDLAGLASPRDYLTAMDAAFRALARGEAQPAPTAHLPADAGGFHIKSARLSAARCLVAVKINANFPRNPHRSGQPTIQGCLVLADAEDGRLLALMDSIEVTARRTAAASALAVRHLARSDATSVALIGCGTQARCHLDALRALDGFALTSVRLFDIERHRAAELACCASAAGLDITLADSVGQAARTADIVVLTTTSTEPLIHEHDLRPGMFIAAVGADSPSKSEISPQAMAHARVVADVLEQAVHMGDLRLAIARGAMTADDVHGELAAIVSGSTPGRLRGDEIFIFDSTGTAIEDVAAAAMLYGIALERGVGMQVALNG